VQQLARSTSGRSRNSFTHLCAKPPVSAFSPSTSLLSSSCSENLQLYETRSHPEMVGDMSRVTLNFHLSKIPFVRF